MSQKTSVLEFTVVALPDENVFRYPVPEGEYDFPEISLSGYYGELALPVQRRDTIEVIRGEKPISDALNVNQDGYEGHVATLSNVPEELKNGIQAAENGAHFLVASGFQNGDIIRWTDNNVQQDNELSIADYFTKNLKNQASYDDKKCRFTPKKKTESFNPSASPFIS